MYREPRVRVYKDIPYKDPHLYEFIRTRIETFYSLTKRFTTIIKRKDGHHIL